MTMRAWRWIVEILQAALILGLPFLRIKGESALRFDIPSLRLHVFGCTLWMQEFFIVLAATIFFTLLIVFVTLVFGRIWCGWLCPQTVLVDFTPFVDKAREKGIAYKITAYALTFLVSILVAASLIWYFVSPYEFIPDFLNGNLSSVTWGFWIVLTIVMLLNYAFLRHKWCATICPYAKLQGVMFDKDTLIIEMDPQREQECIECKSCVRNCPVEIDIRKGLNAACINCAECIDACSKIMTKFNKEGLIHYSYGHGGEGRIIRQNIFIVGAFTVLFLFFSAYLMFARTGVDFTVLPHNMEPRITKDGSVLNGYVLSVKNMLNNQVDLQVTLEGLDKDAIQSVTEPVHLDAGKMDKFPLFVRSKKTEGLKGIKKFKITLTDKNNKDISVTQEANFTIPDEV